MSRRSLACGPALVHSLLTGPGLSFFSGFARWPTVRPVSRRPEEAMAQASLAATDPWWTGGPGLHFDLLDHTVHVGDFPGYVPHLNPDEGVWGWTKSGRLANLAANDKDELWDVVMDELVEVKFRPGSPSQVR
jgi:hypothetical protein